MKKLFEEKNILKLFLGIIIFFTFCLTILFLFGNVSNKEQSIFENILYNLSFIIPAILFVLSISLGYVLIKKSKVNFKDKYVFIILSILSGIFILYQTFILPFAPSFDANNVYKVLQNFSNIPEELNSYFNFYTNNKLVVYLYSFLTGNVIFVVKAINFILIYSTVILISMFSSKVFKNVNRNIAIIISALLIPYGLLVVPYIYAFSIFLTILFLTLYFSDNKILKVVSLVVAGIIYVLRPTVLLSLFIILIVISIYEIYNKKKFYKRIIDVVLVLTIGLIINYVIGLYMYKNKLHAYPNLQSGLTSWNLYVGTSYNSNNLKDTGKWKSSPENVIKDDSISLKFNSLWNDLSTNKITTEEYSKINSELLQDVLTRFKEKVLSNPIDTSLYVTNKFNNLYKDTLSLYMYNPVIYSDTLTDEITNNYQYKYSYIYNIFLSLFVISLIYTIFELLKSKEKGYNEYLKLAFVLSVIFVNLVFVILLEVSKRYTLDFYVLMLILIIVQISSMSNMFFNYISNSKESNIKNLNKQNNKKKNSKNTNKKLINNVNNRKIQISNKTLIISFVIITISTFVIVILNLKSYENINFKEATMMVIDSSDREKILHLFIPEIYNNDKISFINSMNNEYIIKEKVWYKIPFYIKEGGGVALIMNYNGIYTQIKQYDNINN